MQNDQVIIAPPRAGLQLPAARVSALAGHALARVGAQGQTAFQPLRPDLVRRLAMMAIRPAPIEPKYLIRDLMHEGLHPDEIIDHYISGAARLLGKGWEYDDLRFAQVALGSTRLQAVLTELIEPWSPIERRGSPQALMVVPNQETHTLAAQVAIARLRRASLSVRVLYAPTRDELLQTLAEERHKCVMFSCGTSGSLEKVARLVKGLRTSGRLIPPLVAGGPVVPLTDGVKELTGVDLVVNDIRLVLQLCEDAAVVVGRMGTG